MDTPEGAAKTFTIDHLLNIWRPANRVPMHLSPDGRYLSLSVQRWSLEREPAVDSGFLPNGVADDLTGSSVLVVDTASGEADKPFPPGSTSWAGVWSPDGSRLAANVQHEGHACLAVRNAVSGELRMFREAKVRTSFGFEVPCWTPDGATVLTKLKVPGHSLAQGEGDEKATGPVTVYHFDPEVKAPPPPTTLDPGSRGDVGTVNVYTGEVRRLAREWEFRGCKLSPDGQAAAILRMVDYEAKDQQWYFDLVVVPLDGSPLRTIARRVSQSYGIGFNWSPDSHSIAFTTDARHESARLLVVPADGSGEPRDLGDIRTGEQDEIPRWSEDSQTIYTLFSRILCAWRMDGSHFRRVVGVMDEDAAPWRVGSFIQPPLSPILWTPGGRLLTLAHNSETKANGLALSDMETGRTEVFAEWERIERDSGFAFAMTRDGSSCYFIREASDRLPEVWGVHQDQQGQLREPRRLICLNQSSQDIEFGKAQLLQWQDELGNARQGALLLPPGYVTGQMLPLLTEVYGDYIYSNDIHSFGFHSIPDWDNAQLWAAQGYAVLCPDMPMENHEPLQQMPGLVMPAIDHLIDLGIADPDRLGVMGHSYGGYCVLALLTQTDRFKAGVCHSGAGYNLTSYYGYMDDDGESAGLGWCESDQPCLNGTLWEKREEYIQNSPLFFLDQVHTPVLLAVGTMDTENTAQAKEVFSALRRLERRVDLRLYHGEGHCTDGWSAANLRDLWESTLSWFDSFLKTA